MNESTRNFPIEYLSWPMRSPHHDCDIGDRGGGCAGLRTHHRHRGPAIPVTRGSPTHRGRLQYTGSIQLDTTQFDTMLSRVCAIQGRIEARNVTFAYPSNPNKKALDNLSFTAEVTPITLLCMVVLGLTPTFITRRAACLASWESPAVAKALFSSCCSGCMISRSICYGALM